MNAQNQRRLLLLKAAERLFLHYGPTKTTVADIARKAGVGVGTVYLEFPSKDHILAELANHRHGEVLRAMRQASELGEVSVAERLRSVLDARVQAFIDTTQGGAHASDLVHCCCPAVEQAWKAFLGQEHELVSALVAQGIKSNEFAASDPSQTASVILQAYAMYSPPWLFHRNLSSLQEDLTLLHCLILRGLVKR